MPAAWCEGLHWRPRADRGTEPVSLTWLGVSFLRVRADVEPPLAALRTPVAGSCGVTRPRCPHLLFEVHSNS